MQFGNDVYLDTILDEFKSGSRDQKLGPKVKTQKNLNIALEAIFMSDKRWSECLTQY